MAKKKVTRDDIEYSVIPTDISLNIQCTASEWYRSRAFDERRLYLNGILYNIDSDNRVHVNDVESSGASTIVERILAYNRMDKDLPIEKRIPVMLYINSPGGSVADAFAIISAIEVSKTPIYTVNVGAWCSAAFLIGITGHRRFSLPNMTFLMHDGEMGIYDSTSKTQDCMEFNKRFEQEVTKEHILKHSSMKPIDYDALARVEFYMLPEDAMERGFIDEIVTDIDTIL